MAKIDSPPKKVIDLVKAFNKTGFEIYIVGGSARGLITQYPVSDWDLTTNAKPEQVQALFPKNSFYNNRFGTVSIVTGKKKTDIFEVTTYRTEQGYSDKRRPDQVSWGKTLEEDLQRRDLTINAIAIDWLAQKIIDPHQGQKDLKNKIIRTVGNPDQRFQEDALRLIRAVRIATQLGFMIEAKTLSSIKKNSKLIDDIAKEGIRDELLKLLSSDYPADGITLLYNTGLLERIIPELIEGRGIDQAKHHTDDVWTHNLKTLQHCPSKNPIVKLAALLHDIGKPKTAQGEGEERTFHNHEVAGAIMTKEIGKRLRFSKKQIDQLYTLVRWHQFTPNEKQTDKAIRRFIRRVGTDNLQDILDIRTGDRLGSGVPETSWRTELFKKRLIEVQKQPFSIKDLKIDGNDIMKILKIKPGPEIGKILKTLFEEVEEDKDKNTKECLTERVLCHRERTK
ncbi:MAG: HD domain-containing protein [Patescibacteria group bacterium]